jgi:hypothetical protein
VASKHEEDHAGLVQLLARMTAAMSIVARESYTMPRANARLVRAMIRARMPQTRRTLLSSRSGARRARAT